MDSPVKGVLMMICILVEICILWYNTIN